MEGYKFRLQKLLDIRSDREEESKRVFKEAQLEKELVEKKLNNLKDNYNKYRYEPTNGSLVEQKLKHIYLNALNVSITDATKELQDKMRKLDEKRQDLMQKQIDRKTVETLRDNQLKAFIKEQELIEQRANDEFALYGFLRTNERR